MKTSDICLRREYFKSREIHFKRGKEESIGTKYRDA